MSIWQNHCIHQDQFHPSPVFSIHSTHIPQIIIDLPAHRRSKLSVNKSLYTIKSSLSERKIITYINISKSSPTITIIDGINSSCLTPSVSVIKIKGGQTEHSLLLPASISQVFFHSYMQSQIRIKHKLWHSNTLVYLAPLLCSFAHLIQIFI